MKKKLIVVIASVVTIVVAIIVSLSIRHAISMKKIEDSYVDYTVNETIVEVETIEVDDNVSVYTTEEFSIAQDNFDLFEESNDEQIYDDFTSDGKSIEYSSGVYLKDTLDVPDEDVESIMLMLSAKQMPMPYRIDMAEQNNIYVIYNGRGYLFDSHGQQSLPEDTGEIIVEEASEDVQETESIADELDVIDEGMDFDDLFNEDYGDVGRRIQIQIDGFESDELRVHPSFQINNGDWVFMDSRDDKLYVFDADEEVAKEYVEE